MAGTAGALRAAFAHAQIQRLTTGFLAITLGEWVLGTAVAVGLVGEHGALVVALVGARFVPAAATSLVAGALTDALPPRRVLVGSAAARAASALAATVLLVADGPLWAIAAAVWLDAAAGAAYRPAQARLLPSIVTTPAELGAASTLLSTAKSSGQVIGALAGSLLAATAGATAGAGLAVGLFALAALLSWRLGRVATAAARRDAGAPLRSLGVLSAHPGAWRVMVWSCSRAGMRGAWTSLGVLAAASLLHLGPGGFGWLMTAAGAGTILGVSVAGQLVGRRHLTPPLVAALAITAAAFVLIGGTAQAPIALVAMVGWGAGMALADVAAQALLTRVVAPSDTGRVVGVIESAKLLAEGLGAIVAPVAATFLGLRDALIGVGIAVLVLLLADTRGFRRLDGLAVGRVDLLELARGVPLFASLRLDGLEAVVAPLTPMSVDAGTELIRQDSMGSQWYLVRSGDFEASVDGFVVGRVSAGGAFGERGLMLSQPRVATVTSVTAGELLVLERDDFLRALTGTVSGLAAGPGLPRSPQEIVASQPLLHRVPQPTVHALVEAATVRRVAAADWLCEQGEPSDSWLVILSGEVAVHVDGIERRTLSAGDSLGEIGVLHGVPRTASAQACTEAQVLSIPAAALRSALAEVGALPTPA